MWGTWLRGGDKIGSHTSAISQEICVHIKEHFLKVVYFLIQIAPLHILIEATVELMQSLLN